LRAVEGGDDAHGRVGASHTRELPPDRRARPRPVRRAAPAHHASAPLSR
jgi:hypothetical protein